MSVVAASIQSNQSYLLRLYSILDGPLLQVLVSRAAAGRARRREEVRGHWAAVAALYVLV